MSDYIKLKELAKNATPGPWSVDDDTYVMCDRGPIFDTEYSGPEDSTRVETYEAADAAFIAAANPKTVLGMIYEIEALRNTVAPQNHESRNVALEGADLIAALTAKLDEMADLLKRAREHVPQAHPMRGLINASLMQLQVEQFPSTPI